MGRFIVQRLLQTVVTLLGISLITFVVLRLAGDPASMILGEMATREAIDAYRAENGLDAPLPVQYLRFMRGVLTGEFELSLRYRQPVNELILDRLPATLQLGIAALLLALAVGIPVGIGSAVIRSTWIDLLVRAIVLVGQAIPSFYLGILLIMLFSVQLRWLPTGGRGDLRHLILPAITLGVYLMVIVVRFTRSSMLDVLEQDYMRTARAKGLKDTTVILRHALKNTMIPLVTVIGLQTAVIFSGAIVTETIFSWPGLGRFTVDSIFARDYPVVQAMVLFVATLVVLINLAVDILYAVIDPRVSYE
jgi:peptide/nickel transport system permease protein